MTIYRLKLDKVHRRINCRPHPRPRLHLDPPVPAGRLNSLFSSLGSHHHRPQPPEFRWKRIRVNERLVFNADTGYFDTAEFELLQDGWPESADPARADCGEALAPNPARNAVDDPMPEQLKPGRRKDTV